jgi:hypothetical protein
MRWNCAALDALLATAAGRWCHRYGLISVARQNSKTTMAQALVGWWLTEHADRAGPQTVTWTSHDLKLSNRAFFHIANLIDDNRITRRLGSFGRELLELDNGSVFSVQAATAGAGHGLSIDLAVVDECWKVSPETVDHGLVPAQRARPNPLLVMLSTAGDEQSHLLRQWRERGIAQVDTGTAGRLFMAEWSPPPGVDYADPAWWAYANPAMGTTIDLDTLRDEYNAPNRTAFLRASLNLWVQSEQSWLQPGVWDACEKANMPAPERGVVAAEVSMGGDRFYAVRAWNVNGITHVAQLAAVETEDDLFAILDDVYGDVDAVLLTPGLATRAPEGWRKKRTVGIRELAPAVPIMLSMFAAGHVAHDDSRLLAEHVGRAVATRSAGLSTNASGSIELARCLVWAATTASRRATARTPAVAVARS